MTFEAWMNRFWPPDQWPMTNADIQRWRMAFESIDLEAREECAGLCDQLKHSEAWECAEEIRKTINGP
jgi:hypothetical protein